MSMDEFQPTPHRPDIRKVPHIPEMPGKVPPRPDQDPGRDEPEPEIDEEGDPTTIKTPEEPTPEVGENEEPDLDDGEQKRIKDIIKKIKKERKEAPTPQKKGSKKPTIH